MTSNNSNENDQFVTPLREASITLHTLYEELRHAGFNRTEGLYLCSSILKHSLFGKNNNDDRTKRS